MPGDNLAPRSAAVEALPADTLNRLAVAVVAVDSSGALTGANRAWRTLTGLPSGGSGEQEWLRVVDEQHRATLRERLTDAGAGAVECRMSTVAGPRWTRWIWPDRPLGTCRTRLVVVLDLTDDRVKLDTLTRLATEDSLTGITNRQRFLELVDDALSTPGARRVGIVYADLDGFKRINDDGGHGRGDDVLRAVAQRLRQHLRTGDVLGRVGGDEFAVLCVGPVAEVMSVAARVRAALDDPIVTPGGTVQVGITVGMALENGPGDRAEALLDRADTAMYAVKRKRAAGRQVLPLPGLVDADAVRFLAEMTAATDRAVKLMHTMGLLLATHRGLAGEAAERQLDEAGSLLDTIVNDLRTTVFDGASRGSRADGRIGDLPPADVNGS